MPTAIDNLLFDLDGTLIDPVEGITNSVKHALASLGYPPLEMEQLKRFIGPPLDEAFSEFCGMERADIEQAVLHFRDYFSKTGIHQNLLYPGVPQMLETLAEAGKRLYIATSKPTPFAEEILEGFGIRHCFRYVSGSGLSHVGLAKGAVVQDVLQREGVDAASAVMIGDRRHDVAGAKQNGLLSVGVLYGYGSLEEFEAAGADYIVEDIPALTKLLLAL